MLKLAFFFRIAAALALASLLAGSANAQIAASRTWPELKDAGNSASIAMPTR
jgi:hypothetical protein